MKVYVKRISDSKTCVCTPISSRDLGSVCWWLLPYNTWLQIIGGQEASDYIAHLEEKSTHPAMKPAVQCLVWFLGWPGPLLGGLKRGPPVGAHNQLLSRKVPPCLEKQGPVQISSSATEEAIFKYLIAFAASGILHTPFLWLQHDTCFARQTNKREIKCGMLESCQIFPV